MVQVMPFMIYLRLPDPNKGNGGQSSGLFISAFVVSISKNDAPIIIIGKWFCKIIRN